MSSKFVTLNGTFTGIMTEADDPSPIPPLAIWGPNDPRPTNPIAGFNPGTGLFPPYNPPGPPLGTWGPNDPRPTLPIAGWNPGTGQFPPYNPPVTGGMPGQLPSSDPAGSGWVFCFVPGYGWMWAQVPKPPVVEPPPVTEPPPPAA